MINAIEEIGGVVGGGWNEIHQHICVNKDNKEAIEAMLVGVDQDKIRSFFHPVLRVHGV